VPTSQPAPSSDQTTANNANSVERAVKPKIFQTFQVTNQRRHEFKFGGILKVTIHAVNTNPELSSDDEFVSQTKLGLVFSKSRPVIVLLRFRKHMECLPMSTHGGRGTSCMSEVEKTEYLPVVKRGSQQSANADSESRLIAASGGWDILPESVAHVTGSVYVSFAQVLVQTGVLEKSSFWKLHDLPIGFGKGKHRTSPVRLE
jgi:hypothetical protein